MTEKKYDYIPTIAKTFRRRSDAAETLGSPNLMGVDDPRRIAPTIVKVQPKPIKDIAAKYYSRMDAH